MDVWSSGLRADYNDIHDWFRIKWRARLEYELSIAKQVQQWQISQSNLISTQFVSLSESSSIYFG